MSKVHNISAYKPTFTDVFLFDNNIWMYLFCPLGNYNANKQKIYSAFLKDLLSTNKTIIVNSLILSEFSNAYLRLEFDLWKKKIENAGKTNYKNDFVGSPAFIDTVEDVKININKILKITERFSDDFNSIDIDCLFSNFGESDFNDSYYTELARLKKYKIVTDDADFFKSNTSGVEIVTANI